MSPRDIKEKILKTALHNAIINDKEKVTMDDVYFAGLIRSAVIIFVAG